ncbi:YeeE/YedE family protein [Psychromonas ossibalaenae]|uniref:YeeE/YedE family protein n=1 Tax=Psychromonas ossibalaenae TaxID=444922 RepID=UPI00035FF7B7|nr:YeeE/YedE family protein [Psychromonas ossibalaenae]
MENFSPWSALAGGALLGLSAAVLMLFSGKVAGISGIISGLFTRKKKEFSWRLAFLTGMVLSMFILQPFSIDLPELIKQPVLSIIAAGFLVGFGTRLSNGCTSGHGIIGLGRFSKRSITATLIFMAAAVIVVFIRSRLGVL